MYNFVAKIHYTQQSFPITQRKWTLKHRIIHQTDTRLTATTFVATALFYQAIFAILRRKFAIFLFFKIACTMF